MRILTVAPSYGLDGSSTMLRAAIRHWTGELRWRVDALCSEDESRWFGDELAECGAAPVQSADVREYDVILVNTLAAADRIDTLTLPGLKIVLWVHEGLEWLRSSDVPVSRWVDRFSRCARIIYQTAWQRDEVFKSFAALVPPERVAVVPNGIRVKPLARPGPPADRPFRIVCVASVMGRKRQGDLAEVALKLSAEMPIECEFVGTLAHAASAGPRVNALIGAPPPALTWTDALPHAQALERVARADLFCLPSSDESFALAPLEAAALGVPVLLSRLPVYERIGWCDGENCLQHGVGDLSELEAQVRRIVAQPGLRDRIGRAGRQLADSLQLETSLRMLTECLPS